jgi:uncharacterized LabA/DUF88 family protein
LNADKNNPRLAVLIDADNARAAVIEPLMEEIAKLGIATIKRIYGDWTLPNLNGWKDVLLQHAIQPIQQFRNTVGKNATDSAMIIDAMDLLYSAPLDGFCIISSDSDFTRLASRIRESGKLAYGFGEKKTPEPFIKSCDRFIYTEIFSQVDELQKTISKVPTNKLRQDTKLMNLFRSAVESAADDEGWASLGGVGSNIQKNMNTFEPRNYGYSKLSDLAIATDLFETKKQNTHLLLKLKEYK